MCQHLCLQGAAYLCKVTLVLAGEASLLSLELAQLAEQLTARHIQVRDLQDAQMSVLVHTQTTLPCCAAWLLPLSEHSATLWLWHASALIGCYHVLLFLGGQGHTQILSSRYCNTRRHPSQSIKSR